MNFAAWPRVLYPYTYGPPRQLLPACPPSRPCVPNVGAAPAREDISDAELADLLTLVARARSAGIPRYPSISGCGPAGCPLTQIGRGSGGGGGGRGGGGGGGYRGVWSAPGWSVSFAPHTAPAPAPAPAAPRAHVFLPSGPSGAPRAHAMRPTGAAPAGAHGGHPLPAHHGPIPFHHPGHGGAGWALWQGWPFWAYGCWWVLTDLGWECFPAYPYWLF